jgi:hypothetical protein
LGKSKKRIIYKGKNQQFTNLSRQDAIEMAVDMLNSSVKEAYSLITLFGLSAEEMLEAGASYEAVKGMENLLL